MPTSIEWCDETINPLGWGCYGPGGTPERPAPCSYCYAKRIAARNLRPCPLCREFTPHWHSEQLDKPYRWKKPRKIFVQSMGDLMHPCTPEFQIWLVQRMAAALPRHTFMFLTKNAHRYAEFNPWPDNCWLGTTVTNQADADARVPKLLKAQAPVRFVSAEPLLGPITFDQDWLRCPGGKPGCCDLHKRLDWLIIGAMTGPGGIPPKRKWVSSLIDQSRAAEIPVFLKDNLGRGVYWNLESHNWPTP